MNKLSSLILTALLLAGGRAWGAAQRDQFGGWSIVRGKPTGFFHAEQLNGVWWLITPDGNAFFSKGVCNINHQPDHSPALGYSPYARVMAAKYGSPQKWAEASTGRL